MRLFGFIALTLILISLIKADQDLPEFVTQICPDYEMMDEYLTETWEDFIRGVGNSEGLYQEIMPTPESSIHLIGANTSYSPSGENLAFDFRIFNPANIASSPLEMRFMVILNQQQIELEPGLLYHEFTLQGLQESHYRFELPPLAPGIHDLVTLVLSDSSQVNTRMRSTLIIESAESPTVMYQTADGLRTGQHPPLILTFGMDQTFTVWGYPGDVVKAPLNQPFTFWLYAGFPRRQPGVVAVDYSYFALLLLQDGRQIPLTDESPTLYMRATPEQEHIEIPVTLAPFTELGRVNLNALRIDNPNLIMCLRDTQNPNTSPSTSMQQVTVEVIAP
ncbi:MAG: hypothetical protein MUF87_16400 [Anaerolineae bacterium]|jgi:hypothetical protein|nr:hypothetical protein [Anaerolineae bacterium]